MTLRRTSKKAEQKPSTTIYAYLEAAKKESSDKTKTWREFSSGRAGPIKKSRTNCEQFSSDKGWTTHYGFDGGDGGGGGEGVPLHSN